MAQAPSAAATAAAAPALTSGAIQKIVETKQMRKVETKFTVEISLKLQHKDTKEFKEHKNLHEKFKEIRTKSTNSSTKLPVPVTWDPVIPWSSGLPHSKRR